MQTTTNYGLNKPDPSDAYNKANDNANMDAIDTQMKANADAAAAAQATANAAIPATEKGAAGGVASLDSGALVPVVNIPAPAAIGAETPAGAQAKADAAQAAAESYADAGLITKMSKTADSDLNMNSHSISNILKQNFLNATALTIAAGAITVTQSYHNVDTEGAAATDDLTTINGGSQGDILILRQLANGRNVTIKNGIGNIYSFDNTDIVMTGYISAVILIKFSSTQWLVLGIQGVKKSGDTMTGALKFNQVSQSLKFGNGDTATYADIDFPDVSTSTASLRLFRATNTLGTRSFDIFLGDGTSTRMFSLNAYDGRFYMQTTQMIAHSGSPEGAYTAPVGSIYLRTDGGAGTTFYVKESGTGNTGWVAK